MAELTDEFVWVRLVKANDLDLTLFQFDFDLTFAIVFMNADKTIYGRYGSRSSRADAESDISVKGLAESMKAVLQLHQGYPDNKDFLAGKQPQPSKFKTPLDMPTIRGKFQEELNYQGQVARSCVHCHQVTGAQRDTARLSKDPMPERLVFPYPAPQTLGVSLDPTTRATVSKVSDDSPLNVILRAGDEIITLDGEAILSQADVHWVLHHAPKVGTLPMTIRRDGQVKRAALPLKPNWRFGSDIGWRSASWQLRRMTTGGLRMVSATPEQRRAAGIEPDDGLALVVDHVGQYNKHAAAKRAGFKKGDLIVKFGEAESNWTESQLMAWAAQNTRPGQKLPVALIRNGRRMTLQLPMQD